MAEKPDGLNINEGVGSTHPEKLQELVKETGSQIGLAFDGDSDRLIAVDENGDLVDGDRIMYIVGKYLADRGLLAKNTIVTTVMSNLGFHKALDREGIEKAVTAVGDRYVVEEMRKEGYNVGGEQSGHVILMDYNTTGDGQLTAVQLTKIMKETGKKLSELAAEVTIYPQKLVNIRVENSMKDKAMEVPAIAAIIEKWKQKWLATVVSWFAQVVLSPSCVSWQKRQRMLKSITMWTPLPMWSVRKSVWFKKRQRLEGFPASFVRKYEYFRSKEFKSWVW